jgi:CRISPR-associated protein Cas2
VDRVVVAVTVVVAYDISEDRRRSRVAAVLQAYGDRVQRSVFVATLNAERLQEVRERVSEIIDATTDSVYVFRQCAACWEVVGVHGQATVEDEPLYWAVL